MLNFNTNRRTFLQQMGVLAGAMMFNPVLSQAKADKTARIGIQLYTLRKELSKDLKSTLSKVTKIGYADVETFGYSLKDKFWGLNPKAFSDLLKENNLTSFSGHYGIDPYLVKGGTEDTLKAAIEAAAIVGQKYVTVPHVANHIVKDADGYLQVSEKLNRAGEQCKQSGLKLAYHNHNFELNPLAGDKTGYEILLQNTDKKLVDFELDLYWAVRAGKDPLTLFQDHPGRFTMWHVKDMDKTNPGLNTEVGSGKIDFIPILAKAKLAGLKQLFVEQENFSKDPFLSIEESYQYLSKK